MAISHAGSRGFTGIPATGRRYTDLLALYKQVWSETPASQLAWAFLKREQPEYLTIATNNRCNLSCSHCYLQTDDRDEPLTYAQWRRFFGAKLSSALQPRRVCFVGREPLLDSLALDVGGAIREVLPQTKVGLITNGTLLSRWERGLADMNPDFLDISLDGSEEVHDTIRGRGAYRRTMRNIAALPSDLRRRVSLLCSINRLNFFDSSVLVSMASELGIARVVFGFFQRTPLAPQDLSLDADQAQYFFNDLLEFAKAGSGVDILLDVDFPVPTVMAELVSRGWVMPMTLQIDSGGDLFVRILDSDAGALHVRLGVVSSNIWHSVRISAEGLLMGSDDALDPSTYGDHRIASIVDVGADFLVQKLWEGRLSKRNYEMVTASIGATRGILSRSTQSSAA